MIITHKKPGDACPSCGKPLKEKPNQFYLRGVSYPGLLCCNALWSIEGRNIFDAQVPSEVGNATK